MTETPLLLAGDFATPTRADWEAEVLKVLNRRRPEGKELDIEQALARLRTTTVDGLSIEPLYTEREGKLGHPGVMPFSRGTTIKTGAMSAWDVRQLHEDPDLTFTKGEILADLERGATSVWLRLDPDAIAAADLPAALAGVDADAAPICVSSLSDQVAAAKALVAFWKQSGASHAEGNLGLDALGLAARTGKAADLSAQAELAKTVLAEFPGVRALCVDVTGYDDAGAGDIDQLAFAIATGVAYLRDLEAAGVPTAAAFGQILFRVSVNADQFINVARLRALRRLWSRVGEACGVPAAERGAVQHAVSSWRMITRDDPWVNLLRTTIAAFSAAVGGAEAITSLPFDTALGLPDDFSRRMARNVQLLVSDEANVGRVNDPAGGSWYVENLTDQLANKAWNTFQELEASGGMAAALASGLVAEKLQAANVARAKRLATRKQPLTGVSMFPKPDEERREVRTRPAAQVLGGLKARRDSAVFEALRDRAAAAATPPEVFLACLGARRDFGGRETFTSALLGVAGIGTQSSEGGSVEEIVARVASSGTKFVILCSSAKVYAEQAVPVAKALKDAGAEWVYLAGRKAETQAEDVDSVIDGEVFDGMDVVDFLQATLDRIGVAK